jgi:UDP-N-acetylmuramyl pentapeptide phosphotransferase/UDP-N-acetylglucosamine-1-phosphate transferase
LAIIAGTTAAMLVALATGNSWPMDTWVLLAAAVTLGLVGLADDIRGLPAAPRLLIQVLVGGAAGAAVGGLSGMAIGAVVVPAAVNMVNFMDGINGICASHAVVGGLGALLAGTSLGNGTLSLLGALTVGGGLGFLPWNAPTARIFLGDVGSYYLGGLAGLSVTIGLSAGANAWRPEVIGCLAAPYLLFAADTASTLVRRHNRGEPLFEAHRGHVYQQLVHRRGLSHWVVSFGMALVALMVTLAFHTGWVSGSAAAIVAVIGYLGVAPRLAPGAVVS